MRVGDWKGVLFGSFRLYFFGLFFWGVFLDFWVYIGEFFSFFDVLEGIVGVRDFCW